MCTLLVKETVAYYTHNASPVYCVLLDATKAFDRVHYAKLFSILIERKMPAVVMRFLLNTYLCHSTHVTWNGMSSASFMVQNGVKQGGILSPVLFCIYLDVLLNRLKEAKVGCYMGRTTSYIFGGTGICGRPHSSCTYPRSHANNDPYL